MIEEKVLPPAREDVRKRVLEEVDDLTVVERRIRREPAPPAQRGRVSEAVLVDAGQIAFNERVPLSGLEIDSLQPLEPKPLSEADAEPPLTSVPVAREDHRLALRHVETPVGVEPGRDFE